MESAQVPVQSIQWANQDAHLGGQCGDSEALEAMMHVRNTAQCRAGGHAQWVGAIILKDD